MSGWLGDEVGRLLARGALKGRWTIDQLDQPSAGCEALLQAQQRWREKAMRNGKVPPEKVEHRNLGREWVEAHPREWEELMREALNEELALTQP